MGGCIDIFESRRTNFERVEFWKRDINSDTPTSEIVSEKCSGIFYAREVNAESSRNEIVSGSFMFDDSNIMLITNDDVRELSQNDVCKYDGRLWNVVSVQRKRIKKRSEFSRIPVYKTYIMLRN